VVKVNQALNPLDLEFRHLQEETSGREMYAIVSVFTLIQDEPELIYKGKSQGR
jgi:RNAse (barnase) inhibitor barstar